jgi:hypothetical protein
LRFHLGVQKGGFFISRIDRTVFSRHGWKMYS